MPLQKIIGIILIVVVTGLAALFIRASLAPPQQTEAPKRVDRVRIATTDLPTGTLIQSGDLAWRDINDRASDDVYSSRDGDKLLGAVVRQPLTKNQPIEKSRVVLPESPGFLAAALAPGKRAVSVAITDVSGNAGLIQPGDSVDLILTQRLNADGNREVVGETVLTNVRVIAVGHKIFQERDSSSSDSAKNNSQSAATITFEVSSEEAERVAVASQLGNLSLSLRSLASEIGHMRQTDGTIIPLPPDSTDRPRPIRSSDVSQVSVGPRDPVTAPPPLPLTVKVYRGDKNN